MVAEKERVLMDLQDVFEYAFDEIFVTDEKGIVVRVNRWKKMDYNKPYRWRSAFQSRMSLYRPYAMVLG